MVISPVSRVGRQMAWSAEAKQGALFEADVLGRPVPVVGEQKDIRYFGTVARNVLNGPEVTGMGFWSVNPYVGCAFGCAYCYARYTHRWVLDRTRDGESRARRSSSRRAIRCRRGSRSSGASSSSRTPADVLRERRCATDRKSISRCSRGDTIVIGTATDPFQPAERRFRVTRSVLEVLAEHPGLSICIITKSPLITRDIDVLQRINRISSLSIHLSLISLDRELARTLEPRAPTPEARLRALARLRENGIETGINVMPVLPAITDHPDALERLVKAVAERGASYVNACALRLRSTARARYLPFIEQEFPHLAKRYWATYAFDDKVSATYSERLRDGCGGCAKSTAWCTAATGGRWDAAEAVEARFAGSDQLAFDVSSRANWRTIILSEAKDLLFSRPKQIPRFAQDRNKFVI